jgi:hypothetical protein
MLDMRLGPTRRAPRILWHRMPRIRTIFAVEVEDGLCPLFTVVEKPSGELTIGIASAERFGSDHTQGPEVREQRYSIHPSPRSADYTTIKHTLNLSDGQQITHVIVTDAVKRRTGFASVLVRRMPNPEQSGRRVSDKDRATSQIYCLPKYDPSQFTLFHGLFVGPRGLKFGAQHEGVGIVQHEFRCFSLVIPATYSAVPSHHTTEYMHILTLRPEHPNNPDLETALRKQMSGRSDEACLRQYRFSYLDLMKRFLTARLPDLTNPETENHMRDFIREIEGEMQQIEGVGIILISGHTPTRETPPNPQ